MKFFSPKVKKYLKIILCAVTVAASIYGVHAAYNAYFTVKEVVVVEPEKSWTRQVYDLFDIFGDNSKASAVSTKNQKGSANNPTTSQNDSGWGILSNLFGSQNNNTPTKKK